MASLSRRLAQFVAGLRYEDLPPAVIDRAKGVTLQALTSVLIGSQMAPGKQAVKMVVDEEAGVKKGARILTNGTLVTRGGAAFAGSELALAGGKWDTFRMLTHPNTAIIPAALIAAEASGASGKAYLTGVAAGYEVMERMAADFIPTLMARGFHSGPVFGIFGAAVAAAKVLGYTEDQINSVIAMCASLAAGNLEAGRCGGMQLREGAASRNAMLAVSRAPPGHVGGETVLEGDAGFYHAYVGNNRGILTHSFTGDTRTSLEKITENLGKDWMFLETLYRIYYTAGYNIAHIDVSAAICREHDIRYEDVDRVECVVNYIETQYPSPAFPARREDGPARQGGTTYFTAYGVAKRGYPVSRGRDLDPKEDPPEVLELMQRVKLIPAHQMTLFGPRITIFTKDGKSYTKQGTGREFVFDYDTLVKRLGGVQAALPIPASQYQSIIDGCRTLDQAERADALVTLSVVG
jgi:2-methylcitrate dehydratase PrpD